MAKKRPAIEDGSVFLVPLENLDRFGAVRVLQQKREGGYTNYLVAATTWTGNDPPPLSEPQLRETLREQTDVARGESCRLVEIRESTGSLGRGEACRLWVSDPPPESFRLMGVLTTTARERKLKCLIHSGWEYF